MILATSKICSKFSCHSNLQKSLVGEEIDYKFGEELQGKLTRVIR